VIRFVSFFQNKWHGHVKSFLLISFMSIVSLSVGVSVLIYTTISRTLRSQIVNNGVQIVNNLYQENEMSYFHVQSLLRNLMNNTEIREFGYNPQTDQLSERYWWIPIYENLKYYQVLYPNLDDIYIYYPDTDIVISSTQPIMQNKTYFTEKLDGSKAETVDWNKEFVSSTYPAVEIEIFPKDAITFWGMINRSYPSEKAYVFLELDLQYMLERYAQEMTTDSGLHLYENDQLVFSTNPEFIPDIEKMDSSSGMYEGSETICIYSKPDSFGMRYVLTYSKDIFWQTLRNIRIYTVLLLIFYLIIASITIFIYIRWNQQQIQAILKLAGNYGVNMEGRENEFKKIRSLLSNLFYNQLEMQNQMNKQTADARTGFLQNLLTGNFDADDANLEELEQAYSLKLSQPNFLVVLYQAKELTSALFSASQSEIGNRQMLYFAVLNMAEDIFPKEFDINSLVVGTNAVTLLNFSEDAESLKKIQKGCNLLTQKLEDLLQAQIRIVVSQIHAGIGNIQFAYHEVMQIVERGNYRNDRVVLAEQDMEQSLSHGFVRYSLITEQQLINYIAAGEVEKTSELIRQIFQENAHLVGSPAYQLFCSDVLSTLMKSIAALEPRESHSQIRETLYALLQDMNKENADNYFLDAAMKICLEYHAFVKEQNPLYQKLENYIQEHYHEHDLNVSKLGEIFGYSTVYLSRTFKNAVGTSILDYIARIRINKAKDALQDSAHSAQQIAEMVGYCDYHSFLRVFKKMEGISPQKFRENISLSKDQVKR
jgi:AraC-like DNA-binding protein